LSVPLCVFVRRPLARPVDPNSALQVREVIRLATQGRHVLPDHHSAQAHTCGELARGTIEGSSAYDVVKGYLDGF
jgi:hypothetical protein